jgi:hypothetical protein
MVQSEKKMRWLQLILARLQHVSENFQQIEQEQKQKPFVSSSVIFKSISFKIITCLLLYKKFSHSAE